MNIHLPAEPLNIPSLIGCCKKSCNALWLVIIITHITETGQPTNMYIYIYIYIYIYVYIYTIYNKMGLMGSGYFWWFSYSNTQMENGNRHKINHHRPKRFSLSMLRQACETCEKSADGNDTKVRVEATPFMGIWPTKYPGDTMTPWGFTKKKIAFVQKIASPQAGSDHFTLWLWLT